MENRPECVGQVAGFIECIAPNDNSMGPDSARQGSNY